MKNNSLDDIVSMNVSIASPASSEETFDSILLVVAAPATEGDLAISSTISIAKADELLDYGYTTDEPAYIAASVLFSQSPSPGDVYVCVRIEDDDDGFEDVAVTLARANGEAAFYGIHLTEFKDADDVADAITWTEANEKIFGFEYTDIDSCPVNNFSYYRTFGVYSGLADGYDADDQPAENGYAALAWMAKCFGYDAGSETWHLKELATIVPSALSTTQKADLESKSINTFLRYASSNVTIGGYMLSGEWIDVIRFRDWLKAEMQMNVFNALKVNTKVPFTDAGIGLIEGKMEETLSKGQALGGIALSEFDDDGNETQGFTVTVPKSSSLTEAERASRKLTGCKWTARLAGAIHLVEVDGYLTF